jgi:uncharacterized protein YqjF (DUF2071 family)
LRPFLTAEWRHLLMLNYEVESDLLRPHVPAGTELDGHAGRVYASVVAFRFLNTRVRGFAIPWHRDFTELNLRFYVRREHDGEIRRGVVFIREVVPRIAIAAVARLVYNEPYVTLPMRSWVDPTGPVVRYEWRQRDHWQTLEARSARDPVVPGAGSLEEFITDHAWGYTRQRDGSTVEYHVEHERWAVRDAQDTRVDADFGALYGEALGAALARPASVFIVDGSPVTVHRPRALDL